MICRCEEVMLSEIVNEMENGLLTAKELKLKTRTCMGICQGRTCRSLLEQIISFRLNQVQPDASQLTQNHPVRPTTLSDLVQSGKDK